MQITQTRTSAPTTKVYPVPSFWKSDFCGILNYYALLSEDMIIQVSQLDFMIQPMITLRNSLHDSDRLYDEISEIAFLAEYEKAQIQITDAFQTAFPSPVHLEMAHEFNEND